MFVRRFLIPLTINSNNFTADLHLIPFHGADVVLGVTWMENLGDVSFNYRNHTINFMVSIRIVMLSGMPPHSAEIYPANLRKDLNMNKVSCLFFISIKDSTTDSSLDNDSSIQPAVKVILDDYASCFAKPHGLIPERPTDHHIELHPGVGLVKVCPY